MLHKQHEGVHWFEFQLLQPFEYLRHGCFTRKGGASPPPYDSLSVGRGAGHEDARQENVRRICRCLFQGKNVQVFGTNQVHGTETVVIDSTTNLLSSIDADAIVTNLPNIAIMVKHADCQPCIMFDPVRRVIASVHAGWRGSVAGIYKKVVSQMRTLYGCLSQDIIACVGPSLGPEHAEFLDWKTMLPPFFHQFRTGKDHMNFWEATRIQLLEEGITQVEIASICSYASPLDFFSYRRDKITGRNATCIAMVHDES